MPASRATNGLGALPNGAAWYLARIKNNTNLPLEPAAVHELGSKEVARIQEQFTELGPKLGYSGPPVCIGTSENWWWGGLIRRIDPSPMEHDRRDMW